MYLRKNIYIINEKKLLQNISFAYYKIEKFSIFTRFLLSENTRFDKLKKDESTVYNTQKKSKYNNMIEVNFFLKTLKTLYITNF